MNLVATGLNLAYARPVLCDVSVAFKPGEVTTIVGPNGAGKSTLLRVLAGIAWPQAGQVTLDAKPLRAMPARVRAMHIGALLEPPDATFGFTVRELVLLGRYPHLGRLGFASEADLAHVERALDATQIARFADRVYPNLSSGERQLVGIARLLCQGPQAMLLDEPTSRLDPAHALRVVDVLRSEAARDKTVIVVVHDLDLAAKLADRVVVLADQVIAGDGSPSDVLTPELIERVWGVRARRVDDGRPALVLDRLP